MALLRRGHQPTAEEREDIAQAEPPHKTAERRPASRGEKR